MSRANTVLAFCLIFFSFITLSMAQAPPRHLEGRFHDGINELDWDHPESDTQPVYYKIYRAVNLDPSFSLLASTAGREYEDHSIVLNSLYHYRVTAVYADSSESIPSNIVDIFVHADFSSLRPPRDLEGHFHDNLVSLRWHHPESPLNPTSYKVYRSNGEQLPSFLASTPETTYDDNTVSLNTRYHYAVTAVYNDTSESFPSNPITIFTGTDSTHDSSHVRIWFTTEPRHFGRINQLYQYDADVATMPPGVPVCFRLEEGPDGMTIDNSTGMIQWTPTSSGAFEVEIKARACDGSSGEAEQEFHLFVLSGAPGSVAGNVHNSSGEGLRHVHIKLFDVAQGKFVMRTTTDSTGHYSFPFVNPTTYFIRAKPENHFYAPQWYNGFTHIEDATPVVVPESTAVTADFTLQQRDTVNDRFNLSGTVMDASSQPIAGARVMVFRVEHNGNHDEMCDDDDHDHEMVRTTTTDSTGQYHFVLHEGTFIIGARAEHYLSQFWNHQPSPLEANRLHLGQDTSGIDFNLNARMTGTGSISGTIRNAADSSALESHVLGFQKDSTGHFTGFVAFSRTDSAGVYTLDHLPNGSYIVLAKAEHEFVPTFYSSTGGTPFLDSAVAVAVSGLDVNGIDIYVQPDSVDGLNSVAGTVQVGTSNGGTAVDAVAPLAGAIVTITDVDHHVVGSAISESDGRFTASGLAPGLYTVTFQKPGKQTANVQAAVSYINNAPTTTTVDAQLSDAFGSGPIGTMSVRSQWNLVSLPLNVSDAHRTILFPSSVSNAFSFDAGAGYQSADVLNYTSGYWLKFPAIQVLTIAGTERTDQTIPVLPGWNLIGSISTPVSVTLLQLSQPDLIAAHIFGYTGGYSIASTLEPGKGYWVKASANGSLGLHTGANINKSSSLLADKLSELNTITIKDARGNTQVLYFGNNTGKSEIANIDLPPLAPEGVFDVRFVSQKLAELHPASLLHEYAYPISMQSAQGPLTISWSIKNTQTKYFLNDGNGNVLTRSALSEKGAVQLAGPDMNRLVLKAQSAELPKQIALHQNYPNPFNPTTTITFDLPIAAPVTLKVYNIIGQEVRTLVRGDVLNAGQHAMTFDASALSSGMYFYKLQVGTFSSVKKMLLIK